MAFCGVAQAAPPSLHNALRPGAAGVCLRSVSVTDPRSPWAAPAGSPRHTSRWPRPPRRVRAAAADFLGQRRIAVLLPASVWPSKAALRPASGRDRRSAERHPSTATRGATGVARQSADPGGGRGGRSARLAGHRHRPTRPKTRRAATGRLARDAAARFRGGPGVSRQSCAPCRCAGGGGPAHRGWVSAPSLDRRGGQPVAPYAPLTRPRGMMRRGERAFSSIRDRV